jgi:hypothetical protein
MRINFASKSFLLHIENDKGDIIVADRLQFFQAIHDLYLMSSFDEIPLEVTISSQIFEDLKAYFSIRKLPFVNGSGIEITSHVKESKSAQDYPDLFGLKLKLKRLVDQYKYLYNTEFQGQSYFDLIHAKTSTQSINLISQIDEIKSDILGSFDLYIEHITQAAKLCENKSIDKTEDVTQTRLKNVQINHESDITKLISSIQSFIDGLKNIRANYEKALDSRLDLLKEDYVKKTDFVRTKIDELESLHFQFTVKFGEKVPEKPTFLTISKDAKAHYEQYTLLLDNANKILHDGYKAIGKISEKIHDLDSIKKSTTQLASYLPKFSKENHLANIDNIKRVNHLNDNQSIFTNLYETLQDLLTQMNLSGIFQNPYECNARSSIIQLSYVEDLIQTISIELNLLLKNPQIMDWQRLMSKMSVGQKQLLKRLFDYPNSEWVAITKASLKKHFIIESINITDQPKANEYQHFMSEIQQIISNLGEKAKYDRSILHNKVMTNLSKNNPKIYKKSKETGKIEDIKNHLNGIDHLSIMIHTVPSIDSQLAKVSFLGKQFNIRIDSEEAEKTDYVHHGFSKVSLDNTAYTDRYQSAYHITKALIELSSEFEIYQLPFANIICAKSSFIQKALKDEFEKDNLKQTVIKTSLFDALISAILMPDRPKYFIYHDGIINKDFNHLAWQSHVLQHLSYLGYHLLPIFSSETKGEISAIRSLLRKSIVDEVLS